MNSPDLLEKRPAFKEEAQSLLSLRERQLLALDSLGESVGNLIKEKCWCKKFVFLSPPIFQKVIGFSAIGFFEHPFECEACIDDNFAAHNSA